MKSCLKSTTENQGKIWWLVGLEWRGFPLVKVILGGFWVVSDGFCWLRVISDGFKWFGVLVVTPITQHTEELTLF